MQLWIGLSLYSAAVAQTCNVLRRYSEIWNNHRLQWDFMCQINTKSSHYQVDGKLHFFKKNSANKNICICIKPLWIITHLGCVSLHIFTIVNSFCKLTLAQFGKRESVNSSFHVLHQISHWIRSWLWLGHSNTWLCFNLNHSTLPLVVCVWLSGRFFYRIILPFIFLSIVTNL